MVISFDFDDTLCCEKDGKCIWPYLNLLKEYYALGCTCIILTARTDTEENRALIKQFLEDHNVLHCISKFVFTGHDFKGPYAVNEQVKLHYDDSNLQILSLRKHGICVIDSKEQHEYY